MLREYVLEKFEGPLDLLLNLIDDAKLTITEISLGKVTEQFFKHLNDLGSERSDELADFLVVATKLVYLKSKELLPYLRPEEDEGPGLADQLKLYKTYADASGYVSKLWNRNFVGYSHYEAPPKVEGFFPPQNSAADNLKHSFEQLLRRLTPVAPLPKITIDHAQSVKQKVISLYELLKSQKNLNFNDLVSGAKSRSEVIVSFLALLELVKQTKVSISQADAFGSLTINRL